MGRYGNIDYPTVAKRGLLLGVLLFAVGALGEIAGHALAGDLAGWLEVVLLDMMIAGIVVGLFAPLVFGIVLPLTE